MKGTWGCDVGMPHVGEDRAILFHDTDAKLICTSFQAECQHREMQLHFLQAEGRKKATKTKQAGYENGYGLKISLVAGSWSSEGFVSDTLVLFSVLPFLLEFSRITFLQYTCRIHLYLDPCHSTKRPYQTPLLVQGDCGHRAVHLLFNYDFYSEYLVLFRLLFLY